MLNVYSYRHSLRRCFDLEAAEVDILLSFITGVYVDGRMHMDLKTIAKEYAKTWPLGGSGCQWEIAVAEHVTRSHILGPDESHARDLKRKQCGCMRCAR